MLNKNSIVVVFLVSICLSLLSAAEYDSLENLKQEKAAKNENQLLEESKKQRKKPKKNVIYQWVDENGNTVISDVPHEGAIEIKLPKPQTYTAPKLKKNANETTQPPQAKVFEKYNSTPPKLKILSPINDSWLDNNHGNLQINVAVIPNLRAGQILVIKLDKQEVSRGMLSQINLQGLDRGNHTLTVEVQLTKTKKVIASEQSNFNVRRPTVNR